MINLDSNFGISITSTSNGLQFCLQGQLTGWAGIGFGPVHYAMDTYVGWITSSGAGVLQDGYSSNFDIPITDTIRSAQIVSASQTANTFRMCFRRSFNTNDPQDETFIPGTTIGLAWAYHIHTNPTSQSLNVRYAEHTHKGLITITLPTPPTSTPPTSAPPTSAPPTSAPPTSTPPTSTPPTSTPPSVIPSLVPTPVITPSPSTPSKPVLQADDQLYVTWGIIDKDVLFYYECKASGWVGLGFDRSGPIHRSTDTYITWLTTAGTGMIHDGYSDSQAQPQLDNIQSAIVLNASRINGQTQFTFSRPIDTTDVQDVSLSDWILMGWAYHDTTNPESTNLSQINIPIHTHYGSNRVNLYSGEIRDVDSAFFPSTYYILIWVGLFGLNALVQAIRKHTKLQHPTGYYRGSQYESYHQSSFDDVSTWFQSRIPLLNVSKLDIVFGSFIILLNIMCIGLGMMSGFNQAQIWGYMCAANSFLVAIPATRNSFLSWVSKLSVDQTIQYHRWLGRLAIFQAIVHVACSLDRPHFSWSLTNLYGLYAFVCIGLIAITSSECIRRRSFNLFFYSHHIFFAYYTLASFHSLVFFIYTCAAASVYGLDRLIRLIRGIYPRKIISVERLSNRIVKIMFPKNKCYKQHIGQYVFLNFPGINLLEWHPFTLADSPKEPHHEVYIKNLGDHTQHIFDRITEKNWVRVDGPYGHWNLAPTGYSHILFVCGGIGITPCLSFIRDVYNYNTNPNPNNTLPFSDLGTTHTHIRQIILVWCCPNEDDAQWVNQELLHAIRRSQAGNYPGFHLYVFITNQSEIKNSTYYVGRPDMDRVFDTMEDRMVEGNARACVHVCGPRSLSQTVWDTWSRRSLGKRYDFRQEIFDL
jgi:predicted ferric reductase